MCDVCVCDMGLWGKAGETEVCVCVNAENNGQELAHSFHQVLKLLHHLIDHMIFKTCISCFYLKNLCVSVMCACVQMMFACMYMMYVCVHVCVCRSHSWPMGEGQRTTVGVRPHLPPRLKQALLSILHTKLAGL